MFDFLIIIRHTIIMDTNIGFVGLGTMGRPMARHLLEYLTQDRRQLLVADMHPSNLETLVSAGAIAARSTKDFLSCSVIFAMVPDLPQLQPFVDELVDDVSRPVVLVVSSTVSATGVVQLDEQCRARSGGMITVVDAPVSGGEEGAVSGTLSIMVGGTADDFAAVEPLLRTMGTPEYCGPLGSGSVAKACNQMLVAATLIALGEVTVVADRHGLDLRKLLTLLNGGLAASRVLETKLLRLVEQDYQPSGPARFLVKDLGFARDTADKVQVRAPQLDYSHDFFVDLTAKGFGDQDTAVVRAYVEEESPLG